MSSAVWGYVLSLGDVMLDRSAWIFAGERSIVAGLADVFQGDESIVDGDNHSSAGDRFNMPRHQPNSHYFNAAPEQGR